MAARKTFTAEHRAAQAALIQQHRPWEHSTGPRTPRGKSRSSMNALLSPVRREIKGMREAADRNFVEIRQLMRERERIRSAEVRRRTVAVTHVVEASDDGEEVEPALAYFRIMHA